MFCYLRCTHHFFILLLMEQPDMFFILFCLLSGCRKVDAQRMCAEAGIVDVLTRFIDSTCWNPPPPPDDDVCFMKISKACILL